MTGEAAAGTVRFHDHWRSTASYRVRIALNLAGAAYRSVPVDLVAGEQRSEAYLARNPQGLVPMLEIDGLHLTQSVAILDYLEETSRVRLLPRDPAERALTRAVVQAIACDIHPVCKLRVVAHVASLSAEPDAREAWMHRFIRPGLEAVEAMLTGEGPFCLGETPTQADLALVPQLYNARRWKVPYADLPKIMAAEHACARLPPFREAEPKRVRPA